MLTTLERRTAQALRALWVVLLASGTAAAAESPQELWLDSVKLSNEQKQEVEQLWLQGTLPFADLDRLGSLYSAGSPAIRRFLAADSSSFDGQEEWLEQLPRRVASDLALRHAASDHIVRRYRESLRWLNLADPEACSSPQLYWYYRAIACHQLVQMSEAAEAAAALLAIQPLAERRLHELAKQIQRDAETHEPGSLTHIAQQMSDVRRRFRLKEPGEENQSLQQEVIDALDKLIEKAEQQRQQQQQQQAGQMAQGESARPMEQSRLADLKGAGEVDDRDITPGGDWGSLPPAERERVTQQIIRDFPAHYRNVIEDYFRALAQGDPTSGEEGDR